MDVIFTVSFSHFSIWKFPTECKHGETLAGLGSSAAILYYNDFVTYPDNTTEPTDLLLACLLYTSCVWWS